MAKQKWIAGTSASCNVPVLCPLYRLVGPLADWFDCTSQVELTGGRKLIVYEHTRTGASLYLDEKDSKAYKHRSRDGREEYLEIPTHIALMGVFDGWTDNRGWPGDRGWIEYSDGPSEEEVRLAVALESVVFVRELVF